MKNEKLKRLEFETYLNDLGIPNEDLWSNGGRIPDDSNYGTWLAKNDPIAFNVCFNEWIAEGEPDITDPEDVYGVLGHDDTPALSNDDLNP